MNLRTSLVLMTSLAVFSDAVLIAFYPQFFRLRYGMTSAVHVGAYIAAISVAVMCTLPLWARVAKRIEPMYLLAYTQCAAGVLCLCSLFADSLTAYWALTMPMFMCKSSYLLMYPYLMRFERPESHGATIGLLSVVVHISGIFGAVAGGFVLQHLGPQAALATMAGGDFAQMAICLYLIVAGKVIRVNQSAAAKPNGPLRQHLRTMSAVFKLGLVMLIFDFSAFLARPFFSVYWEQVAPWSDQTVTGFVFAIPGAMAVLGLMVNSRVGPARMPVLTHAGTNLVLGALGLALQAAPNWGLMLLGRCLYGWAIFQVVVKLQVGLFKISAIETYARDFSVINFFQNLGVLLASFGAGFIVQSMGVAAAFMISAAIMLLSLAVDRLILGVDRLHKADDPVATKIADAIVPAGGQP